MNSAFDSPTDRYRCPNCGKHNVEGSAFCAECGASLSRDTDAASSEAESSDDSQATKAFTPVRGTETTEQVSPWAPARARDPFTEHDDDSTTANSDVPVSTYDYQPVSTQQAGRYREESVRGFFLGLLGFLLILAVLAFYVYAAWLDDSARETVDSWLPWMTAT